jgi:hypothetical protein
MFAAVVHDSVWRRGADVQVDYGYLVTHSLADSLSSEVLAKSKIPKESGARACDARNRGLGVISLDKIEVTLGFGFAKIRHDTMVDAVCIHDDLRCPSEGLFDAPREIGDRPNPVAGWQLFLEGKPLKIELHPPAGPQGTWLITCHVDVGGAVVPNAYLNGTMACRFSGGNLTSLPNEGQSCLVDPALFRRHT